MTNTYWYDYTIQDGQTFYYKVTANIVIGGSNQESSATSIVSGTAISVSDMSAGIGSKSYWTFISSDAGSINATSGNLYYSTTDFSQYSPGSDMTFGRTYNSLATYKTALGVGWDFDGNMCLLKECDSSGTEIAVDLKMGDGTIYRFVKNGSAYTRPAGVYMNLAYSNGVYIVTEKNGLVYQFNNDLLLSSIIDANGNTLNFGYDTARGNLVSVTDRLGRQMIFGYSSNGQNVDQLTTATDCYGNVYNYTYDPTTNNVQSEYIVITDQQTQSNYNHGENYTYNTNGLLSGVANSINVGSTIEYTSGKVSCVKDPLYDTTSHQYEALNVSYQANSTSSTFRNAIVTYTFTNGLLTTSTDALGHSMNYSYDGDYNVTKTTYLNRADYTDNVNIENDFVYDTNGNLTKSTDPYGNSTYYLNYNSFGEVGSVITPFTHNSGEPVYYTMQNFTYDSTTGDRLTSSQLTKGTYNESTQTFTASGGPLGPSSIYTFDGFGNKLTESSTVNGVTSETQYKYDSLGRLVETIDPDGSISTQGYDGKDNIAWTEDADGARTTYSYDILGRKIGDILPGGDDSSSGDDVSETFTYDKNDLIVDEVSSTIENGTTENDETRHYYDALGRSTSTITSYCTPDASTSSTSYGAPDTNGNYIITSTDEGNSSSTHITYNAKGLVTLTTDNNNCTISQSWYDNCGKVIKTLDSIGTINVTEYDKLGRTIETIGDQGTSPHKNITCTTNYDLQGNVTKTTDATGIVTETTYDITKRPLTVETTDLGSNPPKVIQNSYSYDIATGSNSTTKNTVTDGLGHVVDYYYDKTGKLLEEEDEGTPNSGGEMITLYTYDSNGNMVSKTAPDNSVVTYTYDDSNKLTETRYSDRDFVDYTYDNSGNKLSMRQTIDGGLTWTINEWEYDAQNRVITVKLNGSVIVRYEYNVDNSIKSMKYPQSDGSFKVISYTYDANGRVYQISDATNPQNVELIRKYNYDATTGVLNSLDDYRKFDQGAYNPSTGLGNDGDYTEQAFVCDTMGRKTNVSYTDVNMDGSGHELGRATKESYALTYDNASNILSETIITNYGTSNSTLKEYTYDAFNRLLTEKVNGAITATYTYDNNGNRLTMTTSDGTVYYNHDEFEKLTEITSDQGFSNALSSFTYDNRGNLTSEFDSNTSTTDFYSYDLANELQQFIKFDSKDDAIASATYSYDGRGQRTQKQESGNLTRYYYDGLNLLYTDNGTSQRLEENIMDLDGNVVASKRFIGSRYTNNYYFYRQDVNENITNVIDKDGGDIVGQSYDAYGNTSRAYMQGYSDFVLDVAYASAIYDVNTGLYYMNARYYDPETGSFLTRDSYQGNSNNPWPWQEYGYCDCNPTNHIDKSGHDDVGYYNACESVDYMRDIAFGEVGTGETYINGVGNHVKYNDWYYYNKKTKKSNYDGNKAYWCAVFVCWCADQAGILGKYKDKYSTSNDNPVIVPRTASCNSMKSWYKSQGRLTLTPQHKGKTKNYYPIPGDIVFFYENRGGWGVKHVGIVLTSYPSQGYFESIEGNCNDAVNICKHNFTDYGVYGFANLTHYADANNMEDSWDYYDPTSYGASKTS